MSINKVLITGNLTRDPEVRTTASGSAILSFSVAVNDRRRDPNTGEWSDYANYIDCTMFGARVDFFSRNLAKGSKVAIEGRLRWSQWESRDGSGKRSKIEVVVDDMELMSRSDANAGSYRQAAPAAYAPVPTGNYVPAQTGYASAYNQAPAQTYASAPQAPQAPVQVAPAASAEYQSEYSPAISSPVIDDTSSVYEDDIPF